MDDFTKTEIKNLLTNAYRDGLHHDEILQQLQDAYAFSDERAELIAKTETAFANAQGNLEGMRQAKSLGVNIQKQWICDPDCCDVCLENDNVIVDIDEDFPTGDDTEPQHPNCQCVVLGVVDEQSGSSDEAE